MLMNCILDVIDGISKENILEPLIFSSLISSTDPVATLAIMGSVFRIFFTTFLLLSSPLSSIIFFDLL